MAILKFEDDYHFLSNFYEKPVRYRSRLWPTSEHAYQAMKSLDFYTQELIRHASSARKAKKLGRLIEIREDWDEIKVSIMREIVHEKFKDRELRQKLLDTGDQELVEGNWWGDIFYGVYNAIGENWLGRILMDERESIREELAA